MEMKLEKTDWIFLLLCLVTGITAEEAFFREQIGISFFVFIVVFYVVFFWRFRTFSFSHQRFGWLVLISIWLLAAGYYLYDTVLFYFLNILIIPALVIFHLALITAPKGYHWNRLSFFYYTILRIGRSFFYSAGFAKTIIRHLVRNGNGKRNDVWKKVFIGIAISLPFLLVILKLLISADTQFERLLRGIPNQISVQPEYIFRAAIVLICTFLFFGYMQTLLQKINPLKPDGEAVPSFTLDGIIALTFLLLLDLVYLLFVAVQFKYFFSGTLSDGYTFAEYARRGFFELLFVTLINLSVTTAAIQWTKNIHDFLQKAVNLALTVLVLSSGVLLVSAFMRLAMYEEAYGFTFTRVLAHSFMIFLMVILAYTLVKIWLTKLSLFHFYFIAALIYYTGINVVNIDRFVVKQNITLYEQTEKIDIHYLNNLSASGVLGLIELYEKHSDIPGLKDMLKERKKESVQLKRDAWQSRNFTRSKAVEQLKELEF
ncbi:DUF4153 domain-containing protein [Bacillus benzoevorans]|uniref:DUF4173 domain-containing protein n=1 Tax=Bacillus benzoevorans TaxID=1456 RepID=A0A7X0HT82_9BACI|nr:DUF4173 domain-containing protein [Bacillus benzoevorans]MBB6445325.1 hypothetical protein [Bacillus benzoevorans]